MTSSTSVSGRRDSASAATSCPSRMRIFLAILLLTTGTLLGASVTLAGTNTQTIDHDSLVADVRQLSDLIENVHPDPYIKGGGRVAFHRRLQSTLASVSTDGMTRADFYRLLRPFVTAVGDAHTWLRDAYESDAPTPGGIPLYFGVIGTELYVRAVPKEQYRPLLGAMLISVEGVPYPELLDRLPAMVSADNEYQLLRNLAYAGILWSGPFLADLLPEWRDHGRVQLVLRHQNGAEVEHTIPVPSELHAGFIHPGSRITRPAPGPSGFAYAFLDSLRTTALLVVDGMEGYREAIEQWRTSDPVAAEQAARDLYRRLHEVDAPADLEAVIDGLPSATETFRSLVKDMRDAGTRSLLVDLRYNGGGNSAMYNILLYFLYGREVLMQAKSYRTEVRRHAVPFFESGSTPGSHEADQAKTNSPACGEYDFSGDWYNRSRQDPYAMSDFRAEFEREIEQMPTFADEYRSGRFERHYLPANVIVLSSPQTFSSGYTLLYYLWRAGATVVGTPPAQAGNCFGETLSFELEHSGLTGTISQKQYVYFHDDLEMGRVHRPQHIMTYEELRSYAFDLNAEILLGLDMCGH